ncbi:hypothetical protein AGMMS50230_07410 [Spirochaetia bacterium]|nr:hypothetical protein AGMMS50230_07410 [Spirochaetia bacterium]
MEFFSLSLQSPLSFLGPAEEPKTERLFCFALNPSEAFRIDPEPAKWLSSKEEALELPAGRYYFTQIRGEVEDQSSLIEMAIELQKEGLWERLKLGDRLYVRRLFEDGSPVVQCWRQIVS